MIARPLAPSEPAPSPAGRAGPRATGLERLAPALDLARGWAGRECLALIAGGSHATGDAVWVVAGGRPVSLSDLDLYAVVPDRAAQRAAASRARAARAGLGARLAAMGLAAPLEVAFLTPGDLAGLPARPGTIELRRTGRLVEGDPAWLERLPAWSARDVAGEEVWLLLENRAFELLWAARSVPGDPPLAALRRRHAVLKCALELAAVLALAAGEFPEGAAARVAWARPRWAPERTAEPPWDAALAWRGGEVAPLDPGAAAAERLRTVAAWAAVWRRLAGDPGDPARPFAAVARIARRARGRRRLREALWPRVAAPAAGSLAARLLHAAAGTPRHRLHAAAAARLLHEAAAAAPGGAAPAEALGRDYRRVVARLGWPATGPDPGAALVMAWDRGLLDGQRTEGWS